MARTAPDWHLYRSFLAAVSEGSLSGAARALGVTQPTLGRHIDALEAALGLKLFTRSLEGLAPTPGALRLVPAAEAMAAAASAAERAASGEVEAERGTVRITASEVIGGEVLPPALARLRERHPGIELELVLTNRNEDLLRGDADIAVRMLRPTQEALIAKRIGELVIGLYAHRRYLRRCGTPRRPEDLAGHTLIGFDRDPARARLLARAGVHQRREDFAFRTDNDLAQLAALRAGLGIGGMQVALARQEKDLVPVLPGEVRFVLEMWLAVHRDLRGSRRVRLVFDHLDQELSAYAGARGRVLAE